MTQKSHGQRDIQRFREQVTLSRYPFWLVDMASRVDELVLDPQVCVRFQEKVPQWKAEHLRRGGPVIDIPPARGMLLPEKYAILAAIHDRILCETTKRISPWRTVRIRKGVERFKSGIAFGVLEVHVDDIQEQNRNRLEKCLADVEQDLQVLRQAGATVATMRPRSERKLAASPPSHSDDFTSFNWFGTRYTFSQGNQAECVRVLWKAYDSGGHSLTQETIGKRIQSAATRFELSKVFRSRKGGKYIRHSAWGTMIQQDSKGSYRLVPPRSA